MFVWHCFNQTWSGWVILGGEKLEALGGPWAFSAPQHPLLFLPPVKEAYLIQVGVLGGGGRRKGPFVNGSLGIYLMSLDGHCAAAPLL